MFIFTASISALAMPYRCKSIKMLNDLPVVNFKVSLNDPKYILYSHLQNHLIGLTEYDGTKHVLSGDGTTNSNGGFSFTFTKQGWITGNLYVRSNSEDEILRGDFKNNELSQEIFEIECIDLGDDENRGFVEVGAPRPLTTMTTVSVTTKVTFED